MIVIAGLGNYGSEYVGTRHNMGFETVDKLAGLFSVTFKNNRRFRALTGEGIIAGEKIMLVKPQTYMNLSGEAVKPLLDYYKIPPSQLIVVCDDISLPVGDIRVRERGSAAGQKGVANIIAHLKTDEFTRIRIGIGAKPQDWDLADYVLSRFSKEEQPQIENAVKTAANAVESIIKKGAAAAMNEYNKRKKKEVSKMVGIIGAMSVEVQSIIEKMTAKTTARYSGIHFVKGKLAGKEIVVAKCGMGKVNAAVCAQTMILMFHPQVIINTGVAGSISPLVKVGDVVIGRHAVQHDIDLSPIGLKKGFIQEMNAILIPCSPPVTAALSAAAEKIGCNHFTGIIATGDQFISSDATKRAIFEDFDAMACEMEGAAIAHVCAINNIGFGLVRTISDNADGDSKFDFNKFVEEAAEKSIKILTEFLENHN